MREELCVVCSEQIFTKPVLQKLEEPREEYIFVDGKGMIPYSVDFEDMQKRAVRIDLHGPNGEWISRSYCKECFSLHVLDKYRDLQLQLNLHGGTI
jgi:hypothetical protein